LTIHWRRWSDSSKIPNPIVCRASSSPCGAPRLASTYIAAGCSIYTHGAHPPPSPGAHQLANPSMHHLAVGICPKIHAPVVLPLLPAEPDASPLHETSCSTALEYAAMLAFARGKRRNSLTSDFCSARNRPNPSPTPASTPVFSCPAPLQRASHALVLPG
jgi:hypothetical protein